MKIAILVLLLLALGGRGGAEPGKPGNGRKNGPIVEPPKPGNGNGEEPDVGPAVVFGDVDLPSWWTGTDNAFWVDPDCRGVVEAQGFLPVGDFAKMAIEEPTLSETLAHEGNSAYGFIDWLIDFEGFDSAEAIALRVLQEGNALCADIPMAQWAPGLRAWFDSFVSRISQYVLESVGGIPFGPEQS